MELRILVIDDDPRLLSTLKSLLTEEHHHATTCEDGLEAIRRCGEETFDLVITDLVLPGASGLEVLKETRRNNPETLVVLITGYASLETAVQAIREGAYDYIAKPFRLEEIRILVRNASEKIQLRRENQRLVRELQAAYAQLQGVKDLVTGDREADPERDRQAPFIAGSMLPLYYQGNHRSLTGFLTDMERISALLEKGFVTEEEFRLCKAKLLKNTLP